MPRPLSLLLFCLSSSLLTGQEQWSLMSCIEHAYNNNATLQQSKILVDHASINLKESRHKMFPNLNGELNGGISYGRNVDPTTNEFTTEDILYSNYSLTSSVVLFQGGLIRNSIKQSKLNLESATKDYDQAKNELALTIATYYLNVLQSQERVGIADKNREIAKLQLDQINKLIKAGSKPEADALELQSQLARTDQSYVVAENTLDIAWLYLKQSLRLDPETKMTLEPLTDEQLNALQLQKYTFSELLSNAQENQPGMKAAKLRLESAKLGEKISRALYYPSVYFSASIGSRYSDAAYAFREENVRVELQGVLVENNPVSVSYLSPQPVPAGIIPFGTQFDQFLGYGGGVSVNIPIFTNYKTKGNVQRAKLNTKSSELELELQKEKLSQDIYQALANVKSAIKEFEASQKVFNAAKSSFEKTQKRFDIGMANVFELNQIQTNYLNAETNLLISKYDLVFKQKVLDYYAGKQIRL